MIITSYEKFMENNSNDMWTIIPDSVKELHDLFKSKGKSLYVVGGAVRDFKKGEKPKDFDLCTDATPDEVLEIIKGYRTNLQGKSFGVVVVYTDDQPKGMEIATFREDQYSEDQLGNTRNPDVKFSTIDKDVERRDIPYNALFYDLDKREIVDLVGGIEDIRSKITRFVGDPEMRIKEDSLRILRLMRFNSRYQFTIDDKTKEAIKKFKGKLKIISKERIWAFSGDNTGEIMKAWKQAKDFSEYLELFNEFDLWEDIFPGLKVNTNIIKSKYLEVYLANILKDNDLSTLRNKLIEDFKIETDYARVIEFLISLLNFTPSEVTEFYKAKRVARVSDDVILDWYRVNDMNDRMYMAFLEYKPSVSAQDLMSKGLKGKELGDEIKRLEVKKFIEILK